MLLLDTSVLARWGDPARKKTVVPYLQSHATDRFVTSSLVLFEFFRPAKRRQNVNEVRTWLGQVLDGIEAFDEEAALRAAAVEGKLQRHDETLAMRDLLIASHASAIEATFVTCDSGDFGSTAVQQLLDVDVITP